MFNKTIQKHKISLPIFNKLITTNTTNIFNLQQKNHITPKKNTNFIFIQPNNNYVLTNNNLKYHHKINPYINHTINTHITKTILHNNIIYNIKQNFPITPKNQFILKHQQ